MTGFRTLIVGFLVAVIPAASTYLMGIDWTQYVSPTWALVISGALQIGMRLITSTPVMAKS